jgi:hypothetical protein
VLTGLIVAAQCTEAFGEFVSHELLLAGRQRRFWNPFDPATDRSFRPNRRTQTP